MGQDREEGQKQGQHQGQEQIQQDQEVKNLEQLLERMEAATVGRDQVSIGAIMDQVGSRSFGPLLLLAGVVLFSPLSGFPGMPTTMSLFVLLIAVQLLLRRDHFWLPKWILNRSLHRKKLCKAVNGLKNPARVIDRWLKPRLKVLTHAGGTQLVALVCIVIALTTPALEVVPFSASSAGAALTAFALSLITEDGLLALCAFLFAATAFGLVVYGIM